MLIHEFRENRCAQIQITNGGSLAPTAAELVKFPGAYSNNDPGSTHLFISISRKAMRILIAIYTVNIDIYSNQAQTETTYVIPGPPLYGSSSSSSSSPASSSAPANPVSSAAVSRLPLAPL